MKPKSLRVCVIGAGPSGLTAESIRRALDGVLDPEIFISHRLPLSQYADGLEMFRAGQGRKIQVRP